LLAQRLFATCLSVRRALLPLALLAVLSFGRAAVAHGAGDSVPIQIPPAPPGDGAKAQAVLKSIEARAAHDKLTKKVTAEAVEKARMALQRAYGLRVAGDHAHARMLEGLALEWADAAQALDRASAAEQLARESARRADETAAKVERARALLAETQTRKARAQAELSRAEIEARDSAKGAAQTEEARLAAQKARSNAPKAPEKSVAKKVPK
jgi:hypothetical protein